jgi:hypothetical protein
MQTVLIYGTNDDLIEVTGAVEEEYTLPSSERATVAFDNGVLVTIRYGEAGRWEVPNVHLPDEVATIYEATVLEAGTVPTLCDYSEVAIIQSSEDFGESEVKAER